MSRAGLLQVAKPILFNTDMVQAILDGGKTVTRRVIKPQPSNIEGSVEGIKVMSGQFEIESPFKAGDYLYVRETWAPLHSDEESDKVCGYMYKADLPEDYWCGRWKPSIHMPKEAARIFLEVTSVRVEQLQDITWQQAANEGCYGSTSDEPDPLFHLPTLRGEFAKLWNSTIPKKDLDKYDRDANPWVWVIEFERVMMDD